ncbi:MAG: phosphate ABC transporter substrate-binding protein PstS [Proteobacteria bacterium]|nr:phosphate ABC transporter substrate-binding protein PstS [Pseudomonadota bacterium]
MTPTLKTVTRSLAAGALLAGLWTAAEAADISGAGATFPYPIYAKWAEAYKAKTGIGMNYQSIGSGGGIKQIKSKTVDFGASDMPLEVKDLDDAGLVQFPMVMGGVVPVVNIKGIQPGQLRLDGTVLADIYMNKIKKWNDQAIAALNPGVTLPDRAIAVVHRSDGSGTTFIFADYLSKVSAEWKAKVGANTSVEWPIGLGGKGNEGVAALTGRTDGAIGYVEYAYVKQNKQLIYALMKNKDGEYVRPESVAFQAAAANADWAKAPGYNVLLTDQPGNASWPISGATFILMYKKQDKPETAKQVLDFFAWAYKSGGQLAESLDYVPMPAKVVDLVEATWKREIKTPNGQPVWSGPAS